MSDLKEWWRKISFLWNWKAACKNESRNASMHQRVSIEYAEKLKAADERIEELEKLEKICSGIHYSQIAMNNDGVTAWVKKIASYFHVPNEQ